MGSLGVNGFMYLDMQLTMSSPMEPVIYKIHSNKTNVPGPWGIPWQSHQMKIIINKNVQSKLSTQHNYPEKKSLILNKNKKEQK